MGSMVLGTKFAKSAVVGATLAVALLLLLLYPDLLGQSVSKLQWPRKGHSSPHWGPLANGLKQQDFSSAGYYHDDNSEYSRYESIDAWRSPDSYEPTYVHADHNRPRIGAISSFHSKGEYLKQPLIADYAKNSDKMFFMIKTGATVLWKRLPVHLFTTLTRVPKFALYSDCPGSIGGYEVVDVLANLTKDTHNHPNFEMYRAQRELHDNHGIFDPAETTFNEGWNLDKFKNIPMLAHAYSVSPQSDWFVFMDADSYMLLDSLGEWLGTLDPNEPLYLGSTAYMGNMPFGHGGSGVVLSRKAVQDTVGDHPEYLEEYEKKTFSSCCGDAMVALMLKEKLNLEISRGDSGPNVSWRFQGNSFYDVMVTEEKWCKDIVTFHHLTPHDIELLWEYERLKGPEGRKKITYGDIYRDFYLPYIGRQLSNWDNLAKQKEVSYTTDKKTDTKPSSEGGDKVRPYESFEACEEFCKQEKCLAFRYIGDEKYCGISWELKLGVPVSTKIKTGHSADPPNNGVVSGWNIDLIRQIRKSKDCDPLENDNDIKEGKGDRSEGWYLRLLQERKGKGQ